MSLRPSQSDEGLVAFHHRRVFHTDINRPRLPFIMAVSSDNRCKYLPQKEPATQAALASAASKRKDVTFDAKEASLSPVILAVQRGIREEMRKKPRLHAWLNAQREFVNKARVKEIPSSVITPVQQSENGARPAEENEWDGPTRRPQSEASSPKPFMKQDRLNVDAGRSLSPSYDEPSHLELMDLRLSPSMFEHPGASAMIYVRVENMLARVQMREKVKRREQISMESDVK